MKKLRFFGLLVTALVLAMGFAIVGCSSDTTDTGGDPGVTPGPQPERYEDLVIPGKVGSRDVDIVISTTRTVARTVLTPQSGDSYVIRYRDNNQVISQGNLVVTPDQSGRMQLAFHPTGNGQTPFYGTLTGETTINLPNIPTSGGGTAGGGGGGFTSTGGPPAPVSPPATPYTTMASRVAALTDASCWSDFAHANDAIKAAQNAPDAALDDNPQLIANAIEAFGDKVIERMHHDRVFETLVDPASAPALSRSSDPNNASGGAIWRPVFDLADDETHRTDLYYVESLLPASKILGISARAQSIGWKLSAGTPETPHPGPDVLSATAITDYILEYVIGDDGDTVEYVIKATPDARIVVNWADVTGLAANDGFKISYTQQGGGTKVDEVQHLFGRNRDNDRTFSTAIISGLAGGGTTVTIAGDPTGNTTALTLSGYVWINPEDPGTPVNLGATATFEVKSMVYTIRKVQ